MPLFSIMGHLLISLKELKMTEKKELKWYEKVNRTGKRRRFIGGWTPAEIAEYKEVTIAAIHKAIQRGILRPDSISSVSRYCLRRKEDTHCQCCRKLLHTPEGEIIERQAKEIEKLKQQILQTKEEPQASIPEVSTEMPKKQRERSEIPAWLNIKSTSNEEKYASSTKEKPLSPKSSEKEKRHIRVDGIKGLMTQKEFAIYQMEIGGF